ncbi:transcription factor MYB76-like protein [Cinnamomum micranthum f. kanehirae]|uniref:Transcription factor MYB76-like protein n=1 Tax=Cinnamomum micranthum f. kanehirae TaxID=337451 RepID=A0A3S3MZP1_9MAGN|nr:transcription factor MYB76-like protein [Cinnamomum micranthum f. kanehirae]
MKECASSVPEVGEEDMQGFQQQTTCSSMAEKGVIPGRRRTPEKYYLIKGQWTPDEDELLASLVAEHGLKSWSLISKRFIGRVGKQCRDRWYNHLHPDIKACFSSPFLPAKGQYMGRGGGEGIDQST